MLKQKEQKQIDNTKKRIAIWISDPVRLEL